MAGIKETEEVIAFIQALAETIQEAKADGTIDIFDAMRAIKLMLPMTHAAQDAIKIKEELKDLDKAEIETLLAEMQVAVFAIIKAIS